MSTPRFTPKSLSFLRSLQRNNDRDWFRARKDQYDEHLRAPMIALIERLAVDFKSFAPELQATPKSIFRIYRDTRFSEDKRPLKTNVAAAFQPRALARHQGAGLYIEVAPRHVWVGGGWFPRDTSELTRMREHIAKNHRRMRAVVESPGFRRTVGPLGGTTLQRVPRGYEKDHPAAELLRHREFLAGKEFPATFAYSPKFYAGVLGVYRQVAPLVRFLNEPYLGG